MWNVDKKLMKQIIRFAVVGGTSFVVDYGIMNALIELLGFYYLWASAISFTVSVIVNYILSVTWVFETQKDNNKILEGVLFIILSVIGLGINQIVMWGTVEWMSIPPRWAKIIATAVVMVYNFVTRKFFMENKTGTELVKKLETSIKNTWKTVRNTPNKK